MVNCFVITSSLIVRGDIRYISEEAEKASLPGTIDSLITDFGRMLIVRCLRPDRLIPCLLNFVTHNIGSKFVEPPILRLNTILEDSNKRSPLIFILSPEVDPAPQLQQLAEEKMMAHSRYHTLSLGQGQAPIARKLRETAIKKVTRHISREEREWFLFF